MTEPDKMTDTKALIERLHAISNAIAAGDRSELTMRVPAQPDRDADLVIATAARLLQSLTQQEPAAWMFRYRGRFGNDNFTGWQAIEGKTKPVVEFAECEAFPLYAAPLSDKATQEQRERVLLARSIKPRHKSPPAMWYEWDGADRAEDHKYRYATLDAEEAK
jgi:hypothetical protein